MDEFITIPTGQKAQAVMGAFEEKRGFPGVLGAMMALTYQSKPPTTIMNNILIAKVSFLSNYKSFVTRIYS